MQVTVHVTILMVHKHDLMRRYTIHVIYAYIILHPYITQIAHISLYIKQQVICTVYCMINVHISRD